MAFRTWSPVHNYQTKYPDDKGKIGGGKSGDIVDRFIAELQERLPDNKDSVLVDWTMYLMMIKKSG